jgi:hypothetical protein
MSGTSSISVGRKPWSGSTGAGRNAVAKSKQKAQAPGSKRVCSNNPGMHWVENSKCRPRMWCVLSHDRRLNGMGVEGAMHTMFMASYHALYPGQPPTFGSAPPKTDLLCTLHPHPLCPALSPVEGCHPP